MRSHPVRLVKKLIVGEGKLIKVVCYWLLVICRMTFAKVLILKFYKGAVWLLEQNGIISDYFPII